MTKTKYYDLQMDDPQDDYDVEVVNANLKKIDEQMKTRENATDALQEPEFTVADKRENIASKEKMQKILGKIAKFFTDLKTVAFTGSYKDLTDKPRAATQTADGMLSATDKKAIDLLGAPIGSCATGRDTATKVATLKNFKLAVGLSIAVKFTNTAGTANPASGNLTLNVNGTGAKTIGYFRNGNKSALTYASGGLFCNNATHIFTYDGVYWLCMDWNADNNTTYDNFVKSGIGAKAGLVPAPSKTAGTTKYLREDGAWAVPPDTKTSIINNQTTTVAGFALDARQANPNIDGSLAKQISDLNGSLNVKKYYGKLIATDLVRFRTELALYNSIYIYGHLVMISFSVALTSNIDGSIPYHIITLPDLLSGKIEWNNLCGSFLNSRLCPFVFSDNLNRITLIVQGQNGIVSAGDELRVWGIGFLNN